MKNKNSRKTSRVLLVLMFVIGLIIWIILTGMDRKNLNKSLNETNSFAKLKLKEYEDFTSNDRVKSLVRLLDKTEELSRNICKVDAYGQQELDAYIAEQRLSGAFISDKDLRITYQSVKNNNTQTLWDEIISKDYVKEILLHPAETYTERVSVGNTDYDMAVVARKDEPGIVLTVAEKNDKTLGDITLESVFADLPISMNGVIVVCSEDNTVVSTNQKAMLGKTAGQLKEIYHSTFDGKKDGNLYIKVNHTAWYGYKDKMGEYVVYTFFPSSQVFMTRSVVCGSYVAVAVLIYLLVLLAQSNLEKITLRQSQKRMRIINALGTAYFSISLIDLTTARVEFIKSSNTDNLNMEQHPCTKEYQKKYIRKYIAEEYRDEYLKFVDLETLRERLKGHRSLTCTVRTIRGRWSLSVIVPQRFDKDGVITTVLLAHRDVTADKEKELEQENALRNALKEAENASIAKTRFLNSISHDIRTPMNAVIGFSSLAMTHLENRELVLDYLKKINVSGQHLLSLINDVLDMSRIESGNVKLEEVTVHLPDVIEELCSIVQGNISAKQQKLDVDMQRITHQDIVTDKLRLNQVLLNIVSNAVKFTPVGGRIYISVKESSGSKDGYAGYSFLIKDNGIGMSEDFQKHIFDAFTREETVTKNGIQGTGLGMAISKHIIDMMGGTLTVSSEPGKGTEFTVSVECRISDEAEKQHSPLKQNDSRRYAGKKILLVEDNELNREIAATILQEAGMTVECVEDGMDAVVRMESVDETAYDVILMDIQMPKMDGYMATREIRTLRNSKKANIPIIAMTANAFEEDKQKAYEAGMNGHISKPIHIETIMEALDEVLNKQ